MSSNDGKPPDANVNQQVLDEIQAAANSGDAIVYDPNGGKGNKWDDGSGGGTGTGTPGGGGGYSSGGGGSSPTDTQKQAVANLAPIVQYQQDTLLGKADNARDVYNINDQAAANSREFQKGNTASQATAEWFSRLLNEQSVYEQQRDLMGNARYGSGMLDLNTMMNRVHNRNAEQVLRAMEENYGNIDTAYFDALQADINGWNELAMDTETALRSGAADYAAQVNNISPELANGTGENGIAAITVNGEERPLIDTENRTLNLPDWMVTEYYDRNKRGPQEYLREEGHLTPDFAWENSMRLLNGLNGYFEDNDYVKSLITRNSYINSRIHDKVYPSRKK